MTKSADSCRIWWHLPKKILLENFIFCTVEVPSVPYWLKITCLKSIKVFFLFAYLSSIAILYHDNYLYLLFFFFFFWISKIIRDQRRKEKNKFAWILHFSPQFVKTKIDESVNKKNHTHMKVGPTSEFRFGIYWWTWTYLKNWWSGPIKYVRILIFKILHFFKKNKEKHLEISSFTNLCIKNLDDMIYNSWDIVWQTEIGCYGSFLPF